MGNPYLIPLKNNMAWMGNPYFSMFASDTVGAAQLVPAILFLLVLAIVKMLLSSLSSIVSARISRNAVSGKKIDFSLMRLSWAELLRGARVTLVIGWRAIIIPMLILYGVMIAESILLYSGMNMPETLMGILVYGSAIAAGIWMLCRCMYYQPVYQLMVISPDAKARELADQSRKLMKGNRLRLVGLNLSFFGWLLLFSVFQTIGEKLLLDPSLLIALQVFGFVCTFVQLPLKLYMQTALAAFTKDLLER
jgi:uncharacterized membrane protein